MKNFTKLAMLLIALNTTTAIAAEKCTLKEQEEMSDGSYLCEYKCPSGHDISEYSDTPCSKTIISDSDSDDD